MLTFRSLTDVTQAQLTPKQRRAVTRAMRSLLDAYGDDYDPDDCGFVVLVTEKTTDADALELMGRSWADAIGRSHARQGDRLFPELLAWEQPVRPDADRARRELARSCFPCPSRQRTGR